MSEAEVRAAFRNQAGWSIRLGSPFMARFCAACADGLDRETAIGARMLDWPGNPDTLHDALPLRLAGGLHALVRRGALPELARLYPPNPLPDAGELWSGIARAIVVAEDELMPWLDKAPQTNEVARSAVLTAGFLVIAQETGLPLSLLELGASAGLNLVADRYRYRLGTLECGDPNAPLLLAPPWTGGDPPDATLRIVERRGVDLNPLDLGKAANRERLPAYVWPDQADRLARVEAAIAIAAQDPPPIDRGDAAAWLEGQLAAPPVHGVARVVYHTIAYQYFPPATQAAVTAAIERAGAAARPDTPLAWLGFESEAGEGAKLRLRVWPGGALRLLAASDGHVRAVDWLG